MYINASQLATVPVPLLKIFNKMFYTYVWLYRMNISQHIHN